MISIIVNIKVKNACIEDYKKIALQLTKKFRSLPGCVSYTINQSKKNPTRFVLYERWQSESDLANHIDILNSVVGPAAPGERFPQKLVNMYEEAVVRFYDPIE